LSSLSFLTVDGVGLDEPREWEPAVVRIDVPVDDWSRTTLTVNGQSVSVYAGRRGNVAGVFADWPRSGPGRYRLTALHSGEPSEQLVTIGSRKLGDQGFASLLDELENQLPASIALSLQRAGAFVGVQLQRPRENTVAQELSRLRRTIVGVPTRPGLRTILPAIGCDPHRILATEETWAPRERARRPSPSSMLRVLTRNANIDADGRPIQVINLRADHTVDTYENRLLKHFTMEVSQRLRRMERYAAASRNAPIADELAFLDAALHDARRHARFLNDVSEPIGPLSRTTMLLLKEPRYRALLDSYIEFHRSVWASLRDDALDAPLENLPYLYQVWGTLVVIDIVLAAALNAGFELVHQEFVRPTFGGLFVEMLRNGGVALELKAPNGAHLTVTPGRTFGATGTHRSLSFAQRPDVVVELSQSFGTSDFLFFDPKYKLDGDDAEHGNGRPVKSDVDKMHAYRDAVRDAAGGAVVTMAATLYPGATERYGDGIAAFHAMPGIAEDLRDDITAQVTQFLAIRHS